MFGVVFLYGDLASEGSHGRRNEDVRRGVVGASSGADTEDAMDRCILVWWRDWCECKWVSYVWDLEIGTVK